MSSADDPLDALLRLLPNITLEQAARAMLASWPEEYREKPEPPPAPPAGRDDPCLDVKVTFPRLSSEARAKRVRAARIRFLRQRVTDGYAVFRKDESPLHYESRIDKTPPR